MFDHFRFLDPTVKLVTRIGDDPDAGGDSAAGGGGGGAGGAPASAAGDGGGGNDNGAGSDAGNTGADSGGGRPPGEWSAAALEKQIDRQHRKIKELEGNSARLAELEAENQRLRELAQAAARGDGGEPPAPAPRPAATAQSAVPVMDVKEQARFEVQVEMLQNSIAERYGREWPSVHANFEKAGGLPPDLMPQLLATDDPAFVLVTLGQNPERMQQILDMAAGPRRQAALIKIAMEKEKPPAADAASAAGGDGKPAPSSKRPSGAPPPPSGNPPGGSAAPAESSNIYDQGYDFANYYAGNEQIAIEKAKDEAWFTLRREQKRNSTGRPWSVGGKAGVGGRAG